MSKISPFISSPQVSFITNSSNLKTEMDSHICLHALSGKWRLKNIPVVLIFKAIPKAFPNPLLTRCTVGEQVC